MDKKVLAGRLRALASDDQKRSKAARLRDVLDDVERTLAAGAKRADVLAELNAHGLDMSLRTFETTLKRLRAKQTQQLAMTRTCPQQATALRDIAEPAVGVTSTAGSRAKSSHDPAELDRIICTQPDLAALARLAKRSKT